MLLVNFVYQIKSSVCGVAYDREKFRRCSIMRKSKLFNVCVLLLMSLLIVSTLGATSASARWVNYTFYNYSGRTIKSLYITGSRYGSWGSDLLRQSILSNGGSVGLRYDNKVRFFDVKVVWMDGSSTTWKKHDYRSAWRITLYRKGSTYYIKNN
jgi:hypothetical protein